MRIITKFIKAVLFAYLFIIAMMFGLVIFSNLMLWSMTR